VAEIALVRNARHANSIIINDEMKVQPGSEIVIWHQNHPSNNFA